VEIGGEERPGKGTRIKRTLASRKVHPAEELHYLMNLGDLVPALPSKDGGEAII